MKPCATAGVVVAIAHIAATSKIRQAATSQARIAGDEAIECRMVCFPRGRQPAIQNFNADLNAYYPTARPFESIDAPRISRLVRLGVPS